MRGSILVLNAGSSSLKYRVLDVDETTLVRGTVERVDERGWDDAFGEVRAHLERQGLGESGLDEGGLVAVAHRVVHGGARFTRATLVDDDVERGIEDVVELAPLHNPSALAGIRATRAALPGLPQVAAFDTAYFVDLPAAAATYALDREVAAEAGIRRYGAHGLSHEYVAGEAARLLGRHDPGLRLVVLHLGNGASASAVRGGRPVETSMGLTPLEGLVMGTRAGDVDPGVLLHLLRRGYDADALEDLLQHRSGLQGLAGRHDFRDLLSAVDRGDADACAAYEVYVHRLRKYVGAYVAVLGGLDALVFTAGVGENVPRLRAGVVDGLDVLGLRIDPGRNEAEAVGARAISPPGSDVSVLVVPTDEELAIARQARVLLG